MYLVFFLLLTVDALRYPHTVLCVNFVFFSEAQAIGSPPLVVVFDTVFGCSALVVYSWILSLFFSSLPLW